MTMIDSPATMSGYLDATLGTTPGWLTAFIGTGGHYNGNGKYTFTQTYPRAYEWPAEAERAERELTQESFLNDVYVAPYVMRSGVRRQGESVARPIVHCDVDDNFDWAKAVTLGAFAVGSGQEGHAHVYVPLTESVPLSWHRVLEEGLRAYLDGDNKISDNDLLRPVGTLNHKGENPLSVSWLIRPTGQRMDPRWLASLLSVDLPDEVIEPAINGADVCTAPASGTTPVDLTAYPKVAEALQVNTGDRSKDSYRIICACLDAGLTEDQARWVILQRDDLAQRLAERPDDDVATSFAKAQGEWQRQGVVGAVPPAAAPDPGNAVYPPPAAPLDVARQFYRRYLDVNGLRTLVAWRGGFMNWQSTHWTEADVAAMRSTLYAVLGQARFEAPDGEMKPWNPNKAKVANVLEALEAVAHLATDTKNPAWIGGEHDNGEVTMISCQNGLLDVVTRQLIPHTPSLFNSVAVPFSANVDAGSPVEWIKFLDSLWADDPDSIHLLQEFFGYVLSGRTDMQKILMPIGPPRSGKGTIARVLTKLMGGNVAAPTLTGLTTNFGLEPLVGKPLAIIADARLGNTSLQHVVVERLLSISGEDTQTIDRKYRSAWTGQLPIRFMLLSNELPKFHDSSGALASRLLILQTHKSYLGNEDPDLEQRLHAELPEILMWSLMGLDRLRERGRFTVPESSLTAIELMQDLTSPVGMFIRERCDVGVTETVDKMSLYQAWQTWAANNGHHCGAQSTFGRDLQSAVPDLGQTQVSASGSRQRFYTGINLRPVNVWTA